MPRLRSRRSEEPQPVPQVPPGDRPTVAVLTMARDEAEMLPRWLRHYSAQVGVENLVVLDDNSTDGSTDDLDCTVHRLPQLPGDGFEGARMQLLSGLARGFLAVYDFVVFVDVDEFLVADPTRHQDLRSFLATRRDRDILAPMTLNVLHLPDVEGPLRADEPILGQRRFAKFVPIMCKPSIKQVPAGWRWASHGIKAPFEVDPELYMLHMKFADRDALRRVSAHRKALVDADGRASESSWSRGADDILAAFDRAVAGADPDRTPEFDPTTVDLASIVQPQEAWYRATGAGQVRAMEQMPLRRVPSSLLGML